MSQKSPPEAGPSRTVERAFALIDALSGDPDGLALSEAARRVDLAPSTALRQLRSLASLGYVERRGDGRFVPGAALYRLALRLTREPVLPRLAQPELDRLTVESGESTYLAVPVGEGQAMYVAQAQSHRRIREVSWLGGIIDLADTALGRALSGRVDADGVVVREGAVEDEVTAIVAPVIGPGGSPVAAVSLLGPSYRLTAERTAELRPLVARAAAEIL